MAFPRPPGVSNVKTTQPGFNTLRDPHDVRRSRERLLVASGVGLAAFALYAMCVGTTVTYTGDCGEIISASYKLGIAHPSGYPLYCLLGRLFALLLPLGEIGFRYNLFSAVTGAAAVGVVTATVAGLTIPDSASPGDAPDDEDRGERPATGLSRYLPAVGSGLLMAGFYYFGSQCVIAEVYALSMLMLALLLYCAVGWQQERSAKWLYALALVLGLTFNTHLSVIFLLPALLLYVFIQHRHRLLTAVRRGSATRPVLIGLGLFLAGYSLTLYLPLRARTFPPPEPAGNGLYWWWPQDWGHPVDGARWKAHVTARQYRPLLLKPHSIEVAGHRASFPWFIQSPRKTVEKLRAFGQEILLQYLWCTPLILVGLIAAFKRPTGTQTSKFGGPWLGWSLLSIVVLNVGVQIHYTVGDVANFFFPAYLVLALWMGLGLHALLQAVNRAAIALAARTGNVIWTWRLNASIVFLLAGTILIQWTMFVPIASFRGTTLAREAGLERAAAAERLETETGRQPALLLMNDDSLFSFWYVQTIFGRGTGARTYWGPALRHYTNRKRLIDLVDILQRKHPVALAQWDDAVDARYPYVPLTPAGNLCLASSRALPEPAEPIPSYRRGEAPRPGVVAARFHNTVLKVQECASIEVDFSLPSWGIAPVQPGAVDRAHDTLQCGWVEVLMARQGLLKNPPPDQPDIKEPGTLLARYHAWKQVRRLVVPRAARPGMILRATIPTMIELQAPIGDCDVWTRIVRSQSDSRAAWAQARPVRLTQK